MDSNKFKEGDKVIIKNVSASVDEKVGTIRGLPTNLPIVGGMYIVEFPEVISEIYPFTCAIYPQVNLEIKK